MAWSIVKPLRTRSGRWTALTIASGGAALEAEGIADRQHVVADADRGRVTERQRPQGRARLASTLSSAMSVEGSLPTILAFIESLFE